MVKGFIIGGFSIICVGFIFLLVVIDQIVGDLGFIFEVNLYIGFIVIVVRVVREGMMCIDFIVQVNFIIVFIVYFSGICCVSY